MDEKQICCPEFNPKPWNETEHIWNDKLFIMDTIPQFLHMPLPSMFGKTVTKMWQTIEKSGANPALKDFLMLAHDPSPWKSELYIHITQEVPGANNVKLSGTFLTKVYDGPFNEMRNFIKDFERYVSDKGKVINKLYFYYTYCPKCALKYGHNYIVAFAALKWV